VDSLKLGTTMKKETEEYEDEKLKKEKHLETLERYSNGLKRR
jgi:hypothetical protein